MRALSPTNPENTMSFGTHRHSIMLKNKLMNKGEKVCKTWNL